MFERGDVLLYIKKGERSLSPLEIGTLVIFAGYGGAGYEHEVKVESLNRGGMDGTGSSWWYRNENFVKVNNTIGNLGTMVKATRTLPGYTVECEATHTTTVSTTL